MIDQLATEYANAGKPVVFLEQDVDTPVDSSRRSRWWAAFGTGSVTLPLVMVDSGNQISNGFEDFYTKYKAMVDASLARPPQANITAQCQRVGNKFHFDIQVTNLSGVTLSGSNSASVYAIVYEDGATSGLTKRYVRASAWTSIVSLANGATGNFNLDTPDLSGVNWDKLHCVALVDYRPGGFTGAYDMLQAAFAEPGGTTPLPDLVVKKTANPDPVNPGDQLTYTIEVVNNSNTALHATVTDTLPDQVTYTGQTVWTPTINAGDTWTTTFAVTVKTDATGALVNKVEVTTTEGPTATTFTITNGIKMYLPIIIKG